MRQPHQPPLPNTTLQICIAPKTEPLVVVCAYVARGKARKEPSLLPRIGIDEKAFAKGRKYVSILYTLDNSTVNAIEE